MSTTLAYRDSPQHLDAGGGENGERQDRERPMDVRDRAPHEEHEEEERGHCIGEPSSEGACRTACSTLENRGFKPTSAIRTTGSARLNGSCIASSHMLCPLQKPLISGDFRSAPG